MIHFDEATHIYTNEHGKVYISVTQLITEAGLYGDTRFYDDYSRDRGRYVHKIVELHLKGDLDEDSVDPALIGYYNAWRRFGSESGFKADQVEVRLYNDAYAVAGTADLIGYMNESRSIIDIKTAATPAPTTGIQTAGYEFLLGESAKRYALHLADDGKYRLIPYTDRHDRDVFWACLTLHNWKNKNMERKLA